MTQRRVQSVDGTVEAARRGDRDAFRRLVEAHQHEVYSLACRLVADPHLAEDVAQDAFVRAWRALGSFRGDAAFSTWLHRITVNAAWTARQRRKRHVYTPLDESVPVVETDRRVDPAVAGETLHLADVLGDALADLPDDQRMVVVLKDIEGWSHAEIAEAAGATVGATKVRLHRARKKLRVALEEREW